MIEPNQVFGNLRVIKRSGVYWYVRCDCGTYTFTTEDALTTGRQTSCGCK